MEMWINMTPDEIMVGLEIAIVVLIALEIPVIAASLVIQIDDVYGISNIRKMSRRRWRRFTRKFMAASKRYFTSKEKEVPPTQ